MLLAKPPVANITPYLLSTTISFPSLLIIAPDTLLLLNINFLIGEFFHNYTLFFFKLYTHLATKALPFPNSVPLGYLILSIEYLKILLII